MVAQGDRGYQAPKTKWPIAHTPRIRAQMYTAVTRFMNPASLVG